MEENNKKAYLQVGSIRLYNIVVNYDGNEIYRGKVEDAPEEIRQLKYSKVNISNDIVCEVYSQAQNN
ncbi:MAG: hypothetical protein IJH76_01195 [Clostridia bacterium]|nr:hypothetical protein [Clostridia bacterium]